MKGRGGGGEALSILPGVTAPGWLLAHLSDPHVSTPAAPRGRERLGKRALGYASWQRHRRHIHRREVLEALRADLAVHAPRGVVVTGDFTQLGQPAEFDQAAAWLADLAPTATVLAVPGNHDAYRPGGWTYGAAALRHWLPEGAPWVHTLGPARLVGVSSAVPGAWFSARGRVGAAQGAALERTLADAAGLLRVVLIHHPPLAGTVRWRKALADAGRLRAAVRRGGAELVLHGHGHARAGGWLEVRGGRAWVSGVPSASSTDPRPGRRAAYDLYAVSPAGSGFAVRRAQREWDGQAFVWGESATLTLGSSATS